MENDDDHSEHGTKINRHDLRSRTQSCPLRLTSPFFDVSQYILLYITCLYRFEFFFLSIVPNHLHFIPSYPSSSFLFTSLFIPLPISKSRIYFVDLVSKRCKSYVMFSSVSSLLLTFLDDKRRVRRLG